MDVGYLTYGRDDDDIIADFEMALDAIKQRPESERKEYGFSRIIALRDRYAPVADKNTANRLHADIKEMSYIEQVKRVRAVMGLSLREAKDYVDRLKEKGEL